jgi:hypothetical protein
MASDRMRERWIWFGVLVPLPLFAALLLWIIGPYVGLIALMLGLIQLPAPAGRLWIGFAIAVTAYSVGIAWLCPL